MAGPDNTLYVRRFASWMPEPGQPSQSPGIAFTDPLFRRRLSQLSRMTIQVIHDILPLSDTCKIVFVSFRGEIACQMKINKTLIEQQAVMPAVFSLSVFNAPVALASIALQLKAGYTVITPSRAGDFFTGIQAAAAPLLCSPRSEYQGTPREILFVYADELVPAEYGSLCPAGNEALAFAALLSAEPAENAIPLHIADTEAELRSPRSFLRFLLREGSRVA